ncbi:echinoderm microtubule-associated protein-like 1 [Rhinoraja longicauda]
MSDCEGLTLDDSASAASSMEVTDRIASLEQRVQMQEDEIQLLKSALADVVRRLNVSEEQHAMLNRKGPTKDQAASRRTEADKQGRNSKAARPLLPTLPLRPTVNNGTVLPKKPSGSLRSPSGTSKEVSPATKSSQGWLTSLSQLNKTTKSAVKRSNSSERMSSAARRESFGESKSNRTRTGSTSSGSSGKKTSEGKSKDPLYNAGKRRVIHCKEEGYVKMFLRGRPVTMYMPQELRGTYSLEDKAELPTKKLKLNWVTIATGQVTGITKDGNQAAPHVRIWDSVSLNTLHTIGTGFFDRSICCIAFSKSNGGSTLCAVDDSNDHVLSVWDWQKVERLGDIKCSNEPIFAVDFHPTETNIIVTCGKSHIYFWTLEGGSFTKKQGLFEKHDKPKFVLCSTFAENGDSITGDSSGNILIWGKGTNRISYAISGAHEGGIFALCMLRDGTLVTGGGKDRKLISWDRNYHKLQETEVPEQFGPVRTVAEGRGEVLLVGTTRNFILQCTLSGDFHPITQGHTDELWGLTTHPNQELFLTCGYDKHVTLWDAVGHQPIWSKVIEDPAQSAGFHPSGSVVAIGTQTGRWLVLDTETKDLVTVHTDGNEQLSVMRYSPEGNYLAIGSHDNYIYIYTVSENSRKYSRVGKCSGHSSFITHLDWSFDSQYLISNSGDYEILYWTPSACKQVVSVENVRDVQWASYTCTLGFHVFGVWPEGSDGTDINAVCRSNDKKLLSTGDDFGKVHLFACPCSQARAPGHMYVGHSSHVTSVSFLHNDRQLVSTGGKDMSVMQWKVM